MNSLPGGSKPDQRPQPGQAPGRPGCGISSILIWVALALLVTPLVVSVVSRRMDSRTPINYSTFRQHVEAGNVDQITVSGQRITGQLEEPAETQTERGATVEYQRFSTYLPSFGDEELLALLREQDVQIETQPEQDFPWLILLLNGIPLLIMLGVGYLFIRRMRGQGQNVFSIMDMRKSRAKAYDRRQEHTTFDDVAGLENAKYELKEIIEFLKHPDRFERLGGQMPKGVLLVGPPGTGKTLLARAVAGEAEVPFFNISGSNFMEMFVGVGASRVRDLFEEAKKSAPAIIFIDELDSIGRTRGAGVGGGHDEREQTLNQLLAEMDGFAPNKGVIVMAATNRPDILDQALLRPGRFDRRITVDLPTKQAREEILRIHSRGKPLSEDVDLDRIAQGTPGFSGADLENLMNEAALLAARQDKEQIEGEDIDDARDKVLMGLERANMALTEDECRLLAYHEGGHAVVAAVLPNADPIHKVTIVPRGRAMGVTQQLPERDRYVYDEGYMRDRLAVMMGGRVAERMVLHTTTSGSEDDLKQATRLARRMVINWGMSEELGPLAYGGDSESVFLGHEIGQRRDYSEATAREIDQAIKRILQDAYDRAHGALQDHREGLDRVARALIEREEIPGDEVLELLDLKVRPA